MAEDGVANFNNLVATTSGPISVGIGSGNLSGVTITSSVDPAAATQLVFTTQPPVPTVPGQAFAVAVSAEDAYGNLVPSYNGTVTISFPGTTTSVQSLNGISMFTGLMVSTSAQGATIVATAAGLNRGVSNPIVFAPEVMGLIATTQKYNAKHKPVGKPKFAGFEFDFTSPMNVASVSNKANFTLSATMTVKKKIGKKTMKVTQLNQVGFSLSSYNPVKNSITLTPAGKQTFPKGGQIVLSANPTSGIRSIYGVPLDGNNVHVPGVNATFTISANEKGLTHSRTLAIVITLPVIGPP
jgi:hypothetical protein